MSRESRQYKISIVAMLSGDGGKHLGGVNRDAHLVPRRFVSAASGKEIHCKLQCMSRMLASE